MDFTFSKYKYILICQFLLFEREKKGDNHQFSFTIKELFVLQQKEGTQLPRYLGTCSPLSGCRFSPLVSLDLNFSSSYSFYAHSFQPRNCILLPRLTQVLLLAQSLLSLTTLSPFYAIRVFCSIPKDVFSRYTPHQHQSHPAWK